MRIELDNAQSTPHIDIMDDDGVILTQISFCEDDVLINDKPLSEFPEQDGIVIHTKGKTHYDKELVA